MWQNREKCHNLAQSLLVFLPVYKADLTFIKIKVCVQLVVLISPSSSQKAYATKRERPLPSPSLIKKACRALGENQVFNKCIPLRISAGPKITFHHKLLNFSAGQTLTHLQSQTGDYFLLRQCILEKNFYSLKEVQIGCQILLLAQHLCCPQTAREISQLRCN